MNAITLDEEYGLILSLALSINAISLLTFYMISDVT